MISGYAGPAPKRWTLSVAMALKKPENSRVDATIKILACATVVGLAGIAAAISYSHMHELAIQHGESGWRGHAFPLSVDGIELTASLVLLAHRRAGTRAGVLPWAALIAGTLASLAANVAVGAVDLIGRAVAGWPAIALLVAIKLLAGLLDSRTGHAATAGDEPEPAEPVATPVDRHRTPATGLASTPGDELAERRTRATRGTGAARLRAEDADLVAAAHTAHSELSAAGQRLSHRSLVRALRRNGHAVSNARAGELLTLLRDSDAGRVNGARPGTAAVDGGERDD
jgi:hypothetical protein